MKYGSDNDAIRPGLVINDVAVTGETPCIRPVIGTVNAQVRIQGQPFHRQAQLANILAGFCLPPVLNGPGSDAAYMTLSLLR